MKHSGRVIEVYRAKPNLDLLAETLEAIAGSPDGDVDIVIGFSREDPSAVGLMSDLNTSLYRVCPQAGVRATAFSKRGSEKSVEVFGGNASNAGRYRVNMVFEEGKSFDSGTPPYIKDQEHCIVACDDRSLGRVSVDMQASSRFIPPKFLLGKIGDRRLVPRESMPRERQRTTMNLSFSTYYHVDLAHQIYDDVPVQAKRKDRCRVEMLKYPVSTAREIVMPTAAYRLLRDPLVWNARGRNISDWLKFISGQAGVDQIAHERNEEVERVEGRMRLIRKWGYLFLEGASHGVRDPQRFEQLLKEAECPPQYTKIFIEGPLGCLDYLTTRPDGQAQEYGERIAFAYNRDWARFGGAEITANKLVKRR